MIRSIKSSAASLQFLCSASFPNSKKRFSKSAAAEKFNKRRERQLRRLLCRCPWWIDGHLHLGLLQIELAEAQIRAGRADSTGRLQLLETMRVSAEAVEELISHSKKQAESRYEQGAEPKTELLEARFLRAMELYFDGQVEQAYGLFSELLLPRFRNQLRQSIWLQLHEYAGYSAMTVRGLAEATALFSAIPAAVRGDEIEKLLSSAQNTGTASNSVETSNTSAVTSISEP